MYLGELVEGIFLRRLNRFLCKVKVKGEERLALLRNTGRLQEILSEGAQVFLRERSTGKHRLELLLVKTGEALVCVDSHLPPKLLLEHLSKNHYPWELKSYKPEPRFGRSKFDLLLNDRILIETKSVNLVKGSVALFPDAPTLRGRRHILDLIKLSDLYEPALIFVIQRPDASYFSPNWETDPAFSQKLKEFYLLGFTVKAFLCSVTPEEIYIKEEVPVRI